MSRDLSAQGSPGPSQNRLSVIRALRALRTVLPQGEASGSSGSAAASSGDLHGILPLPQRPSSPPSATLGHQQKLGRGFVWTRQFLPVILNVCFFSHFVISYGIFICNFVCCQLGG